MSIFHLQFRNETGSLPIVICIAQHCYSNILDWVGPLLFCDEEVLRVPSAVPGIYLLHTFNQYKGYYPPVYVGQTRDILKRLTQHLCVKSTDIGPLRRSFRLYFTAAPVLDPDARRHFEAGLITALRPVCNRQVPKVRPLFPNLPPLTVTIPF